MKKMTITFPALLLAFLATGASMPMSSISCPSAEDLYPCKCNRLAYGLFVVCDNFNDNNFLTRTLRVLRDYQVQNLLLHGLNLTEVLPSDVFDGLAISEIRVEKSLLRFSEPAFRGLDNSLHVLNVAQNSKIKEKSTKSFSIAKLNKLTRLNIKANPLLAVSNKWLNGKIPNVESIVLEDDDIKVIESRAFAELSNLKTISLSENRLKAVERSMFPRPARELLKIDLSGNEIKSIPFDFFFDMPKLEEVILSGNDLECLPENTWKTVWEQLDSVLLFENNLVCDDRLNWIKKLRWPNHIVATCAAPSHLHGKKLTDVYKT